MASDAAGGFDCVQDLAHSGAAELVGCVRHRRLAIEQVVRFRHPGGCVIQVAALSPNTSAALKRLALAQHALGHCSVERGDRQSPGHPVGCRIVIQSRRYVVRQPNKKQLLAAARADFMANLTGRLKVSWETC